MQKNFSAVAGLSGAEKALREWGVEYARQGGRLFVQGDIDIGDRGLEELPDLSNVSVKGNFKCSKNKLASLKGSPRYVGGYFDCHANALTTLEGAPAYVGSVFDCHENRLVSLKGGPEKTGASYYCNHNNLTSLEGAPAMIHGAFYCNNNKLESLAQGPRSVKEVYKCENNALAHIEGVAQKFGRLISDLGQFGAWDEVPESLRLSPQTRQRQVEETAQGITTLSKPVAAQKRARFSKKNVIS